MILTSQENKIRCGWGCDINTWKIKWVFDGNRRACSIYKLMVIDDWQVYNCYKKKVVTRDVTHLNCHTKKMIVNFIKNIM